MSFFDAIKLAMNQEGFAGFQPSLEIQVKRMIKGVPTLIGFSIDVSGGKGQALLAATVSCVP